MEDSKPPNQTPTTDKSTPTSDSTPYLDDLKEVLIGDFIQRREEVIKKITQIYQETEDKEKRVLELRRLIFTKPVLQEAIGIQNILKSTDSDTFKIITSDIETSFKCLQSLKDFYQAQQQDLPQAEKIRQTSDFIESTWQQIYQSSIYDPILINEISKLEWILRASEVLNHPRTGYSYPFIEYCEVLKNEALASQSEDILTSKFYKRIEEELQIYHYLIEKVRFFFQQEGNPDSAQKIDGQQVKELWQELLSFGFGVSQEIKAVENTLKRGSIIVAKFSEFLRRKVLVSGYDLKELMSEINSLPIRFERIEELLNKFIGEQKKQMKVAFQETYRRIIEGNKELSARFQNDCVEVQKIIEYGEKLAQDLATFKFADFSRIRRQITERGYEFLRAELWLAQMKLLQIYCESLLKPFHSITFDELHCFLHEIEDYVSCLPVSKRAPFDEKIGFLHRFLHEIKVWIEVEREKLMGRLPQKIFYGFIDVTKEIMKPKKPQQQQQLLHLEFHSTGIQFKENPGQIVQVQNMENENQEIESFEKIEKKIDSNESSQLVFDSFGVEIKRTSQLDIVDEK